MIGLGYVGAPTAAVLAKHGIQVTGVDIDQSRVDAINSGASPIFEPSLSELVRSAVTSGNLKADTRPVAADAFIIAVPTPNVEANADLSYVREAIKSVAAHLQAGNLVVLESTLPVGATEACSEWLSDARSDLSFPHEEGENSDVRIAYCPERVLPGQIVRELINNDRIIGGVTRSCALLASQLYQVFLKGDCQITASRVAELSKLVENAYRDVNIAFANEVSLVGEALGIDPWEVIDLANRHPRVNILQPGPGVGGHCIPIDPWFIVHSAPRVTPLIRTARLVNDGKPESVANQILSACKGLGDPVVACLGLAYKADTDDLRASPAIATILRLRSKFAGRILIVEPHVSALPPELAYLDGLELTDLDDAIANAQIIAPLTDHAVFRRIAKERLFGKRTIDPRGIWRKRAT